MYAVSELWMGLAVLSLLIGTVLLLLAVQRIRTWHHERRLEALTVDAMLVRYRMKRIERETNLGALERILGAMAEEARDTDPRIPIANALAWDAHNLRRVLRLDEV